MASAAPPVQQPRQTPQQLEIRETTRGKVYVGELPGSFLRLPSATAGLPPTQNVQVNQDAALAQNLAQQSFISERVNITVIEAKLNKNYGMTKMDPYCRIKIGKSTYETPSCPNGAKSPQWQKIFSAPIDPETVDITVDIYDERAFTGDNRVAWAKLKIPDSVKEGKVLDDWWPLSGKLGEEKEGMIHLQMYCQKMQQPVMYPMGMQQMYNPMMVPQAPYYIQGAMPATMPYQPQQIPVQPSPQITEQDVKQVKEMFPDIDEEVIKTVLEASRGNKDAAINSLLSMQ